MNIFQYIQGCCCDNNSYSNDDSSKVILETMLLLPACFFCHPRPFVLNQFKKSGVESLFSSFFTLLFCYNLNI